MAQHADRRPSDLARRPARHRAARCGRKRALVIWLRWFQLPLGVAIFVMPGALAVPLVLLRVFSFVAALWIFALLGWHRAAAKA